MKHPDKTKEAGWELADKPLPAKTLRLVHEVAKRHFGERPRKIVRRGGGLTNTVLEFKVPQGSFVFRMNENAAKVHDYFKEQWAMEAARAVGVPTPQVLEVGNLADGRPYMILEHVKGIEARRCPDRLKLVAEMGRFAARLHTVRTRGYGRVFDWSSNQLSRHESWADYLANGFDAESRLAVLQRHRMVDAGQAQRLRASIEAASGWRKTPVLHHGDLRLKNLIVDPETWRTKAVIDWETCTSSPPPFWDLSISLHDLGTDEKEAFLHGYGMKPRQFAKVVDFLRVLNVLNYAHAVRSAAEKKDRDGLEWFRLRLAAGLELYQP